MTAVGSGGCGAWRCPPGRRDGSSRASSPSSPWEACCPRSPTRPWPSCAGTSPRSLIASCCNASPSWPKARTGRPRCCAAHSSSTISLLCRTRRTRSIPAAMTTGCVSCATASRSWSPIALTIEPSTRPGPLPRSGQSARSPPWSARRISPERLPPSSRRCRARPTPPGWPARRSWPRCSRSRRCSTSPFRPGNGRAGSCSRRPSAGGSWTRPFRAFPRQGRPTTRSSWLKRPGRSPSWHDSGRR